jgi:predicted transposase/invertase (TIGR01784 family)
MSKAQEFAQKQKPNIFQRQKDLEYIEKFRMLDDDFMKSVFDDKPTVEFLLRIILNRPDLVVISVRTEYVLNNLYGRSVRLDIVAVDEHGKIYNIEIQRTDKGAGEKRARYNMSLIDANATEPGDDFENIPEAYVIFITEKDHLGKGLPIYHIERTITETGEMFDDKAHIIYVNAEIVNDTPLGKLMHDFRCTDYRDMNYPILSERVRYFKEDEEGVSNMCRAMEQMRAEAAAEAAKKAKAEGIAEGKAEGRAEGKITGIIEFCFDEGKSFDETVSIVVRKFKLSHDKASELVSECYG